MAYTSAKCSQQVEHELNETFCRLELKANEVTSDISEGIEELDGKQIHFCFYENFFKNILKNQFCFFVREKFLVLFVFSRYSLYHIGYMIEAISYREDKIEMWCFLHCRIYTELY